MADNISKYNKSLTAAEKAERGRKAGKASGDVRRENKLVKDRIHERITGDDWTEIVDGLIERAKENTRDFEVLRDTIGEKPRDSIGIEDAREPIVIRVHNVE